jgi:precorrin-2 dehydrogenase/sirohydrochlorin ferrochelatase
MTAYPVVLRLSGKRVLVVGGGAVAARKVEGLLAAGAAVTVVAPTLVAELRDAAERGDIVVVERSYRSGDVDGSWLVLTATDDAPTQQQVFDDAEAAGIWVNAADDPQRCSFFLPAVHRRDPVLVAVSTQGTSPALAAWLRDHLAAALPERLEELVAVLARRRAQIQAQGHSTEDEDWQAVIEAWTQGLGRGASGTDEPTVTPPNM